MPASVQNPADIVNLALERIGYNRRVGSLYDGSDAANAALTIYAQTRDQLLRQNDWGFAQRTLSLTLLKAAPANYFDAPWNPATNPPPPWLYEYAYPGDAIKIRAVKPQPLFLFNPAPQPYLFNVYNDNATEAAAKTILCNIGDAIAVYTGQVLDPSQMEPDFIEAFAAALGRRMSPLLIPSSAQNAAQDEMISSKIAEREQG